MHITAPTRTASRGGASFAFIALAMLVLVLQFSPMAGLLGFGASGLVQWTFIGVARDALVLLVALAVLIQTLVSLKFVRPNSPMLWALGTVFCMALIAVNASAELAVVALNLRRLLLFPLLFLAVQIADLSSRQIDSLLRLIAVTCLLVATFGVVEYMLPLTLWSDVLRVVAYFSANPLDPFGSLPIEESGRFFSWDLAGLTGGPVRRAVSTYLEPTTLAAALMCGVGVVAATAPRRGRAVKLALIITCGLLTLSKAFLLFLLISVIYLVLRIPPARRLFLLTLVGGLLALLAQGAGLTEGKFAHVEGLATALVHVVTDSPLGEGLANAGNYAAEGADLEIGAESGLGNMLAQIGLISFVFVGWVQSIGKVLEQRSVRDRSALFMTCVLLGWYVSFLFSASSLGIGGNALIFLAFALVLHRNRVASS